ncbi:MAG: transcriptional regulator [Deltaproteobacteria bacterium HGW-Deltaproteobacteria-19]|jgi:polyhydroxyalkanoate synthesis repressor PhaR|nr:MAG: transcriptional regulator [Deltaproteobacteria bacterium HGW-Deltaproteobacteria-19]
MAETLLVKKYGNRRLYDTERSAYITLEDLTRSIKEGRAVTVADAKTKEDVTSFILTQILLEESRKREFLLPVPLLHLIIRFGDNLLSDFFENYLQQILKNYLTYRAVADDQFRKWLDLGNEWSQAAGKTASPLAPFQNFLDLFSEAFGKAGAGEKEKEPSL